MPDVKFGSNVELQFGVAPKFPHYCFSSECRAAALELGRMESGDKIGAHDWELSVSMVWGVRPVSDQ